MLKTNIERAVFFLALLLILGCASQEAPRDANNQTPEQVLLEAYDLIVRGDYEAGKKSFSEQFIKEMISNKGTTFEAFHNNPGVLDVREWRPEWLKAELVGNDYNDDVWRAQLIIDAGKGKENPPGVVHDFHLIDGVWKIVLWFDYPKS